MPELPSKLLLICFLLVQCMPGAVIGGIAAVIRLAPNLIVLAMVVVSV
jgi:hypothetical protein